MVVVCMKYERKKIQVHDNEKEINLWHNVGHISKGESSTS